MWQCCSSNDDVVVNTIEKEQTSDEDIVEERGGPKKNPNECSDVGERTPSTKELSTNDQNYNEKKFKEDFKELIYGYQDCVGGFVDMSRPRDASYASKTELQFSRRGKLKILKKKRLGNDVIGLFSYRKFSLSSNRTMPTEVRGITLRQLRAIIPLIKRRCKKENWTRPVYKDGVETDEVERVTLENATLYDINEYITKPFTKYSQKSFVETLPSTKGTQPPRWFVSHYWGETIVHTMECLEQMVEDFTRNFYYKEDDERGGGMTEDTPVWICAFANNQHDLKSEITSNPADSAFAKAMSIANFRVISILDVNNQVYSRLWCMYELYLTLILSKEQDMNGLLAIYTYHEHGVEEYLSPSYLSKTMQKSAVGLVDGQPTNISYGYYESLNHFPKERFFKSLSISIQDTKASRDDDRKHILNALVGRRGDDMELEPLKDHENYETINNAVRGAMTCLHFAASDDRKNGYWDEILHAMKHSLTQSSIEFHNYLDGFKAEDVVDLFHNLPIGLEQHRISNCPHGRVAMDAFLDWLENTLTNLKKLYIFGTCIGGEVGGKECGERLARFLARDVCKIDGLILHETDLVGSRNVDTWIECLEKNQSLKYVKFRGMVNFVKYVGESELPNTSINVPLGDDSGSGMASDRQKKHIIHMQSFQQY
ncbi:hypothetical protein CTEN210_00976 [Chaetoceros tenuissimus]|uniref:Uncharacterized protein n=1 Tax=Chaetoceros tenuissimus TaxID=426638 RepID=A0AAD3CE93_9STRA|nr:hypothetical protein CTEN210_00976 [Chaetoceros tenuissimus]